MRFGLTGCYEIETSEFIVRQVSTEPACKMPNHR